VISCWLITHILSRAFSVSRDDDLLSRMWAVVATIFVYRYAYEETIAAVLSRIGATLMSFVLCLAYLVLFLFSVRAMAMPIGIGTVLMIFLRRHDYVIITGMTTAVVMVVAAVIPDMLGNNLFCAWSTRL
jgi:predicted Kef-type K+ transport protein